MLLTRAHRDQSTGGEHRRIGDTAGLCGQNQPGIRVKTRRFGLQNMRLTWHARARRLSGGEGGIRTHVDANRNQ
jgi:hypothetical protein